MECIHKKCSHIPHPTSSRNSFCVWCNKTIKLIKQSGWQLSKWICNDKDCCRQEDEIK